MKKSAPICVACGTQIEEWEYVSTETGEKFPLCRKHRKPIARALENTGHAKQTWIPTPKQKRALPGFEWVTEGAEIGVRGRMMACGRGDEIGDNLAGCLMTRSPITTPS